MMHTTVTSKTELIKAFSQNIPTIHLSDSELILSILTKPHHNRCIARGACMNGYRMRVIKCLGAIKVSFYKHARN